MYNYFNKKIRTKSKDSMRTIKIMPKPILLFVGGPGLLAPQSFPGAGAQCGVSNRGLRPRLPSPQVSAPLSRPVSLWPGGRRLQSFLFRQTNPVFRSRNLCAFLVFLAPFFFCVKIEYIFCLGKFYFLTVVYRAYRLSGRMAANFELCGNYIQYRVLMPQAVVFANICI